MKRASFLVVIVITIMVSVVNGHAAFQVNVTSEPQIVCVEECGYMGPVTLTFDAGTVIDADNWITFDLPVGIVSCENLNYTTTGQITGDVTINGNIVVRISGLTGSSRVTIFFEGTVPNSSIHVGAGAQYKIALSGNKIDIDENRFSGTMVETYIDSGGVSGPNFLAFNPRIPIRARIGDCSEASEDGGGGNISLPKATTGRVASVGATSVTLTGTVNPNGYETDCYFEYGTSSGDMVMGEESVIKASKVDTSVQLKISNLSPLTEYCYRLVATNSKGSHKGNQRGFTTHMALVPLAITGPATPNDANSATLTGTINTNGDDTTYHFEYGTTQDLGHESESAEIAVSHNMTKVSAQISDLIPGTIYYYRLVATNVMGTDEGEQLTLTTPMNGYDYYIPLYQNDATRWTGLGIANLSNSENAEIKVMIYDINGELIQNITKSINPNGQDAFMLETNKESDGWVQIEANQPLAGLSFIGDDQSGTKMVDVPFVQFPSKHLVIPHIAQNSQWDTIIYVANPNPESQVISVSCLNADGTVAETVTLDIPAHGSDHIPLSSLAAVNHLANGRVNIIADQGVVAFAVYSDTKTGGYCHAGISAVSLSQQ